MVFFLFLVFIGAAYIYVRLSFQIIRLENDRDHWKGRAKESQRLLEAKSQIDFAFQAAVPTPPKPAPLPDKPSTADLQRMAAETIAALKRQAEEIEAMR